MNDNGFISIHDPRILDTLRQLEKPKVKGLYFSGDPSIIWSGVRVGIVGSRTARDDSLTITRRISAELAASGITIVSGLARGVDGVAHQAAIDVGGKTIAVLASGLSNVYPTKHRKLAKSISESNGVVITEYGSGSEPAHAYRFPLRNRIIAALSDYLIVIQAQTRSGSMSTAHAALDLGIPIGIGPIDPSAPAFQGALSLIRDGADTVVDGLSVIRRMELHEIIKSGSTEEFKQSAEKKQTKLMQHPFAELLTVPRTEDDLVDETSLTLNEVRSMLFELEEQNLIENTADGQWVCL